MNCLAYKTVLHSYGLDSNPSTEEEENSDLELMEVGFNHLQFTPIIHVLTE